MSAWIFWSSLILIAYTYSGYAMLVSLLAHIKGSVPPRAAHTPAVTVVITAYNEAQRIAERLRNILAQDYPPGQLFAVVASDGSDDGTERMAAIDDRVRVLALPDNRGKAAALNAAMAVVDTEFVVFTDARQRFAPDAVRRLLAAFADPQVGAVTGELEMVEMIENRARTADAGLYWRMEQSLREGEALLGWLHGVSGAVYALRKELFCPLPPGTILDDMWVPLHVGFVRRRIWMARDAIAYDVPSATGAEEYRRKLRTLAGNWQLIARLPRLLNPWRNPLFFPWVSHKLLRLIAPWALIAAWVTAGVHGGDFFRLAFYLQSAAYLVAVFALLAPRIAARIPLLSVAASFVMLNAAALLSLPACLALDSRRLWKKH
jgi:cellulose synthase/poly-beta-1,6-N-acetylglucosamine synthase-like glycosyltransferase